MASYDLGYYQEKARSEGKLFMQQPGAEPPDFGLVSEPAFSATAAPSLLSGSAGISGIQAYTMPDDGANVDESLFEGAEQNFGPFSEQKKAPGTEVVLEKDLLSGTETYSMRKGDVSYTSSSGSGGVGNGAGSNNNFNFELEGWKYNKNNQYSEMSDGEIKESVNMTRRANEMDLGVDANGDGQVTDVDIEHNLPAENFNQKMTERGLTEPERDDKGRILMTQANADKLDAEVEGEDPPASDDPRATGQPVAAEPQPGRMDGGATQTAD